MIVFAIPSGALAMDASGKCGENVSYSFNSLTGKLTISGSGKMYDYGTNVDDRSPFCFSKEGLDAIKSITIKSGVTSIGTNSFYCCERVKSVSIPNTVTEIGEYAFIGCEDLSSVTLPGGLTRIEDSAFYDCSITTITIPKSVTVIGTRAFNSSNDDWETKVVNYTGSAEDWAAISFGLHPFSDEDGSVVVNYHSDTPGGSAGAEDCRWCGEVHDGGFLQKLVAWIHNIFAMIFGAKY